VPPSDPKSLAAAIEVLLADGALREKMGRAAKVHAHESFGLPRYQDRLRDVIDRLVTAS
jgi:glycosyltransferase involved in cell wall biosynthesis